MGGYDEGYAATDSFWGTDAASLVRQFLAEHEVAGYRVLDIGCGEGKNANALANAGAHVSAIDCSELAIQNGQRLFHSELIKWRVGDATVSRFEPEQFDIVVSYGLFHCMPDAETLTRLIEHLQAATWIGGHNIFCTFNDRSQDLSAHPGFSPLLLEHQYYLDRYVGWTILSVSDSDLHETHPHNNIPHHHSLTRMIVRKNG
jgi:tellurite methyltransferase